MKVRILSVLLLFSVSCVAQVRKVETLTDGWQFSRDGKVWETVSIPHDWAIAGPFDKKWDLQNVAIVQNGEKEKTEKSGRSGALPWIGQGVYRRTFTVPARYQHVLLHFDGAMSEPEIEVNGHHAGSWAYGYNAFRVDVTPFLHHDGRADHLVVRLNNRAESSRWYPGGGLYRPVTLIMTGRTYLDRWKTFIRTLKADSADATVAASVLVSGIRKGQKYNLLLVLRDHQGKVIDRMRKRVDDRGNVDARFQVRKPNLWSPETPYLYTVETGLFHNGVLIDQRRDHIGIRTISFSRDGGFRLNGVSRKFKGVCLHHDLGPLGAAVNKSALIRQVRILKNMGCDAIRTAHNMPSTMQMDVYDSLGMMVMAESFDMWIYPKCKNGYSRFFKDWADKDITNLVLNHRNHPSLVMYSIGNEIPEQGSALGVEITKRLQGICHRLDPTRPVTQGLDRAEDALRSGFAQALDVPSFNYRVFKYDKNISQLPQGFLLGSETASTVSSRGVYKFPVVFSDHLTYPDGQCSSYDTQYCSWGNLPDIDFAAQEDKPYTIGQFVWSGFDYLGEPTPYDSYWPSRSSYFGICDLAGLPKDRYYLYRSVWNKKEHTIHLLPHWTWPGREGLVTPVYCYTDYDEAELFVNGRSQGRIKKNPKSVLDRYRLRWNHVIYEPGELKVVVYDQKGRPAGQEIIHTAGAPDHLVLSPDRDTLSTSGEDLSFITVSMVDRAGNECPEDDRELYFRVTGSGKFEAVCNGDATSLESFKRPQMKLFHGKLVVIVRGGKIKGVIHLEVTDRKGMDGRLSVYTE